MASIAAAVFCLDTSIIVSGMLSSSFLFLCYCVYHNASVLRPANKILLALSYPAEGRYVFFPINAIAVIATGCMRPYQHGYFVIVVSQLY